MTKISPPHVFSGFATNYVAVFSSIFLEIQDLLWNLRTFYEILELSIKFQNSYILVTCEYISRLAFPFLILYTIPRA